MKKKKIVTAVLTALPAVFALCLCFYFSQNAINQIPNAIQMNYNLASSEEPLAIADIESLSERISMKNVSFCAELNEIKIKEEAVTPVLTNESLFEVQGVTLQGEGITKEAVEKGEKIAVISDTLALKLFFNTNAVGKAVNLDGEEYKICGIYKEKRGLINDLSRDGKQRIYIPYTCLENYESRKIQIITYDNRAPSAPLIEQMNLSQYHSTNLAEKSSVIKDFNHIIYLVLYIVLCVVALRFWYGLCRKFLFEIREDLQSNYFSKSIKTIPQKYIFLIITAAGIPAILIIIFLLSDFGILIPSKYIPYDNIFDVSYYLSVITQNSNTQNALSLTGNNYLMTLYLNSFSVLLWLTVIAILLLGLTAAVFRDFFKNNK